tara:strand:- start:1982 stop:4666 length:2685 start_codon:yes stop_codon:yes gene_type:complete
MREDSERTVQNMRQRAEMEISERRRTLAQEKEDQAATKRMEEKNFQIQSKNMDNEIRGLQLKQQADQQQSNADAKANQTVFDTIANISETAAKVSVAIKEQQEEAQFLKNQQNTDQDQVIDGVLDRVQLNISGLEKLSAVQDVEDRGANPRVVEGIKSSDDALQTNFAMGTVVGWSRRGGFTRGLNSAMLRASEAKIEAGLGGLTYEDKVEIAGQYQREVAKLYGQQYKSKYIKPELEFQNNEVAKFLSKASNEEVKQLKEQRRSTALANIESAAPELFNSTFNHSWGHIVDAEGGDRKEAWKAVTAALNAQDYKTGNFYREEDEILDLIITTKDHPDGIRMGDLYTNKQGQPVGVLREILSDRMAKMVAFEKQQEKLDNIRDKEYEEELVRAVQLNPTEKNIDDAARMYVQKTGGKSSQKLVNLKKFTSIEAVQRNNEFERIAALPDHELTQELVDVALQNNPTGGAEVQLRYNNGPGQMKTKKIEDKILKAEKVITGTTDIGTAGLGKEGSLTARLYFTGQIRQNAELIFDNGKNGFTAEQAVAKAIADETKIYDAQYRVEGAKYYRKVDQNGLVSYPGIDAEAGDVVAAEKSYRKMQTLKRQVKTLGFNSVLNIPHSVMTPERMEYIAQNPNTAPTAEERRFVQYSNGMPMHEFRNRAFAAAGRTERFESPLKPYNMSFTSEQQRIINDANASFDSKAHVVNMAAGNTQYYAQASSMRYGSPMRQAVGSRQENAFIQTIRTVEGTAGPDGYNTVYGGAVVPQLTKMTLGELYDAIKLGGTDAIPARLGGGKIPFKKDQYNSSASGALQLMPETLKSLVETGGYSWNNTFSPEIQDRMILDLARQRGVDIENMSPQQMEKAGKIWAGATPNYGQTDRTAADSYDIYQNLLQQ